jgi:hypothetical protein
LLQVFSAYLGIDTTTGSCPAAIHYRSGRLVDMDSSDPWVQFGAVPSAGADLSTLCCQITC